MCKFLFHPHITVVAMAANLIAVATVIAGLGGPLEHFFGKTAADDLVNGALIAIPVAGFIAGIGRSPIKAVDNSASGQG